MHTDKKEPSRQVRFLRRATASIGALLMAGSAFGQAAGASAPIGSDFDFAFADLSRSGAFVEYGTAKLLPGGKVEAQFWAGDAKQGIPAMADTGPLSPSIEPAERSVQTDKGHKVLSNPHAFSGPPRSTGGEWWQAGGGVCLRLAPQPVVFLRQIPLAKGADWGGIYRSQDSNGACDSPPNGMHSAQAAASSTVALLSERVYDRSKGDFRVKYQRFDGIISRLNGWDPKCELKTWERTELHFSSGVFESAGKDVWRNITMEHQPKGQPDMAVFSYLAIPQQMTPVGRVVLMDVGHDFNRNGRIDDDWGHIYAGFPIISKAGDLGGLMMVDMSPVGIKEIPFKGGCSGGWGSQLTNTLGLILYLSEDMGPNLGS